MKTKPSSTSSSSGWAYLLKLGGFLALTTCLVASLEVFTRWMMADRYQDKYAATCRPGACPNVILGASTALGGIHPRYLEDARFGIYNFAYSGGNATFFRHWYRLFRQTHAAPALVLYATDWSMFQAHFLERTLEADAEYLPWPVFSGLFGEPDASPSRLIMNRLSLVKNRAQLKNLLFWQEPWPTPALYYKGFCTYDTPGAYQPGHRPSATVDTHLMADFQALLDTLKADGTRVVFVQPPNYTPDAGEHPEAQARLAAIARARAIPYLNYNGDRRSALNTDRGLYQDWLHLNLEGAERFSRLLRQDLDHLGVTRGASGNSQRI